MQHLGGSLSPKLVFGHPILYCVAIVSLMVMAILVNS